MCCSLQFPSYKVLLWSTQKNIICFKQRYSFRNILLLLQELCILVVGYEEVKTLQMNVDFDILISLIMPVLIHPGVGGGLNKWLLRGDAFWTWASPLTSMTSLRQLFPQSFGKLADDMRELDGSYLTQTSGTVWTLEPGGEQIWPKFGPIPHTCYLSQSLEQPKCWTHISMYTQSPCWSTGPKFMCDKSWMGHLLAIKFKLTLWLMLCVRKKTWAQKKTNFEQGVAGTNIKSGSGIALRPTSRCRNVTKAASGADDIANILDPNLSLFIQSISSPVLEKLILLDPIGWCYIWCNTSYRVKNLFGVSVVMIYDVVFS